MDKGRTLKEQVLANLGIRSYYSEALGPLKEEARGEAKALCPFHTEEKPSLYVNLETGLFHCFGCGEGGSIFDFHMKRHGLEFKSAFLELAQWAGVEVIGNGNGNAKRGRGKMKGGKNRANNRNLLDEIPFVPELIKWVGLRPLADQPDEAGVLPVEPICKDIENDIKAVIVVQRKHEKLKEKLGYYLEISDNKIVKTKSFFQLIAEHRGTPFIIAKDVYYYYAKKLGREPVATYNYVDAEGKLLYQVLRYQNELTGNKNFRQRRPDGNGGWIWNLEGIERVPYNLPDVTKADVVYLLEGEKDCDNANKLLIFASCNNGGAGNWRSELNKHFENKFIIILPDADTAGFNHGQNIAENLHGIAASIKILELPGLSEKGDFSDWLAAGGTKEQLLALVENTPFWEPSSKQAASTSAPSLQEPSSLCGYTYVTHGGHHCLIINFEGGVEYKPLCNFSAQITDEITRDDGLSAVKEFTVAGQLAGLQLPAAKVTAKEFDSMGWVRREWGTAASITPNRNNAVHLPNAILAHSRAQGIERRTVFAHTGWRKINGIYRWLHGAGAIGLGEPVAVDLGENLRNYQLPEPGGLEEAMASLRFLEIGPWEIMAPLWASIYLAPFSDLLKIDFSLWLYGPTGSLKSTLAALALAHFGSFTRINLPGSWFSTVNSLEKLTFILKDTLIVIDDFCPPANPKESHAMAERAGRIIYQAGNRSARGRLGPDLMARPNYYPRCLIISTGEMMLPGQRQSATARYLGIELNPKKTPIDKARLTEAQKEAHLYPAAIAAYLEDLAPRLEDVQAEIKDLWEGYRTAFQKSGHHLRVPEALAWLAVGFELGLRFNTSMGAITSDQSYEMLNRAWRVFQDLGEKHSRIIQGDRPTLKFMAILRELFYQGKIYVESASAAGAPPQNQHLLGWHGSGLDRNAELVGWANERTLYLLPEAAERVVKEAIRRQGDYLSLGHNELLAALVREGISDPAADGRTTQPKWIQGGTKRVICIALEKLNNDEVTEK